MKKISRKIVCLCLICFIILLPSFAMAVEWLDYKYSAIPIKSMAYDNFNALTIALCNVEISTMSAQDKEDYKNIVAQWKENPLSKNADFSQYQSIISDNVDAINRLNMVTGAPTTQPNPTSQVVQGGSQTSSDNADEGEYIYGTEGIFDWEESVDLNAFNSTDLAAIAPRAEAYIKTDMNSIKASNMDKYLRGLEMILNNSGFKTDPTYKNIYTMAQARLKKLAKRSDITEAQKNKINNLQQKATTGANDNTGNTQVSDPLTPTPTPRTPKTGNKKPDELASYNPEEKTSPDEIVDEGSDFIQTGKDNQGAVTIDGDKLRNGSNMLFNVAFATGVVVASVIGVYLGVKFMLSGAEEKANIKETLLPYFMGVIIMFSSFSIWKLVLVLLENIDKI